MFTSVACDVRVMAPSLGCGPRHHLLAWYVKHEHTCIPKKPHDNFQFGVPSEMKSIAENDDLSHHRIFWGLDSFRGLPDVDNERYRNPLWKTGAFADVYQLSSAFLTRRPKQFVNTINDTWEYIPRHPKSLPITVEEAIRKRKQELQAQKNRITLVPGFYNNSLTESLARSAMPAFFVDLNCDLYISTIQALRWLLRYRLLQAGTVITYDDWFNTPFGDGESRAHMEITTEFQVHFEALLGHSCHVAYFRIRSIGLVADNGISMFLRHKTYWN